MNWYILYALINISTVYLCEINSVNVRHYDLLISQRHSNCLTSKNVRRDSISSRFCKTAWMEIGFKLPFVDKFTRLCLSKQIYLHWVCATDVGDFSEKATTWRLKCPSDQPWNWDYVTHWHEECTDLSKQVFATTLKLRTATSYLHISYTSYISYICII